MKNNKKFITVQVSDLLLDKQNPRLNKDNITSEEEIINDFFESREEKEFLNLIEDILEHGLNPTDLFLIMPSEKENKYIVLEGNRRLVCLKLINNPSLAPTKSTQRKIQQILEKHPIKNNTLSPNCIVVESREEAIKWIEIKHADTNKPGIGTIKWDSKTRAKWGSSKENKELYFQIEELLHGSPIVPVPIKTIISTLPRTNVTRLFGYVGVRTLLDYSIENGKLIIPKDEQEKNILIAKFSNVLFHIYLHNLKVDSMKNASLGAQLIRNTLEEEYVYLEEGRLVISPKYTDQEKKLTSLFSTITPPALTPSPDNNESNANIKTSNISSKNSMEISEPSSPKAPSYQAPANITPSVRTRPINTNRNTLINYSLNIKEEKINQLFKELKTISLKKFPYAAAISFRTLLEISCDWYIYKKPGHSLSYRPPKEGKDKKVSEKSSLKEKITGIAYDLQSLQTLDNKQLEAILMTANTDGIASVKWLHACVHNYTKLITKNDLIVAHDNLQPLISGIWR